MRLALHRPSSLLAAAALLGAGSGCPQEPPPPVADAVVVAKAKAALQPFQGALKEALTSALAVSPESAIEVCANRAPELARAASKGGIVLGRSAIKLRQPTNRPEPWLAKAMAELAAAPSRSDAYRVVPLDGGRRGYAEAIWVGAPCLVCHGESLSPSVDEKLRARYPDDGARGFRLGDFRGVFWAELDAASLRR